MKVLIKTFAIFTVLAMCTSCAILPKGDFDPASAPKAPDYRNPDHWAALPSKVDSADLVPDESLIDKQSGADVDIFFLYPTTYTGKRGQNKWNASVDDPKLNARTDKYPIRFQASIFNSSGKIYAPRYRQAHLHVFYTKKKQMQGVRALDLAYSDVEAAFEYFLRYYSKGRPFIIASHSQGTMHAAKLIERKIDGTPLQQRLVAAYLVGMPIQRDRFDEILPCEEPDQTMCFCSWRTFRKNYNPRKFGADKSLLATNPLSWKTNDEYVKASKNKGALLYDFYGGFYSSLVDAEVYDGLLWVKKPKVPWSFLLTTRNYHIADYNFFYLNVRQNAETRVKAYLENLD